MKAHGLKLCCCFLLPVCMCIDVDFILSYVTNGSYVSRMSTHFTLATVYKTTLSLTEEMLIINEPVYIEVGLQLDIYLK